MTFSCKLQRLIDESGWSVAEVGRRLGLVDAVQVFRWLGKARPKGVRAEYEANPKRDQLVRLSEMFGVDTRWLIDDAMGWEERPGTGNVILDKIRNTSAAEQLEMWEWHLAKSMVRHGATGVSRTSHDVEEADPAKPPARKPEVRRKSSP